tara:strand:- start:495 stop:1190 length:696 start_codon:yes stop_codon:yes gene_type:complete
MKKNALILIIFLSSLMSQSMYLGNTKRNAYSVYSFYNEGENKTFTSSVSAQNSYHEYGIGFSSVLNGNHEMSILSRKNNIDAKTWEGFIGSYNFHLKPKSPVKYFFGTSFSRIENKNDSVDEYCLKFGLYGDIKGSKKTGLSFYPFLQLGQQKEIINFESSDDLSNYYNTATIGVSLMFQDSKTTGIGIEPSYSRVMFDEGDKDCSLIDCDYYYIALNIYLWEYGTFKQRN